MAGTFTPTGAYSNLTRLELEQLRRGDYTAGGKALTIGDSGLAPEGVVGAGNVNAEPFATGTQVVPNDVQAAAIPAQPGKGLLYSSQYPSTPDGGGVTTSSPVTGDGAFWYGPALVAFGTTGSATAANTWQDGFSSFDLVGPPPGYDVQIGDVLIVNYSNDVSVTDLNDGAVGTVSAVTPTSLTLTNINNPTNVGLETALDSTAGHFFPFTVIRPSAVQLFAVPGSGPLGEEQSFLFVKPDSTLHNNVGPTVDVINADRLQNIVAPKFALDTSVDRADAVYASPAPRSGADKLGYRVIFYPDNGTGTGPDLANPIGSLNPIIDPAIPVNDQRVTIDYKAGVVRFSCAPKVGGQIKVAGGVNATTGRLNLYAVFWAYRSTAASAGATNALYVSRAPTDANANPARMHWDEANATWVFNSPDQIRLAGPIAGTNGDNALRLIDQATTVNTTMLRRINAPGVSVGDGSNSFGDFNGADALDQVKTFWAGLGTATLRVLVKHGSYNASATTFDVATDKELHLVGDGRENTVITLTSVGLNGTVTGLLTLSDLTVRKTSGGAPISIPGSIRAHRCAFTWVALRFTAGTAYRSAAAGPYLPHLDMEDCEFNGSSLGGNLMTWEQWGTASGYYFRRCSFQTATTGHAIATLETSSGTHALSEVFYEECTFALNCVPNTNAVTLTRPGGVFDSGSHSTLDLVSLENLNYINCTVTVIDDGVGTTALMHLMPLGYAATDLITSRVVLGRVRISGGRWSVPDARGTNTCPFFLMALKPIVENVTFVGGGLEAGNYNTGPAFVGVGEYTNAQRIALRGDANYTFSTIYGDAFVTIAASGSAFAGNTQKLPTGLVVRNVVINKLNRKTGGSGALTLVGPDILSGPAEVSGVHVGQLLAGTTNNTGIANTWIKIFPGGVGDVNRGSNGSFDGITFNAPSTIGVNDKWADDFFVGIVPEGRLVLNNLVVLPALQGGTELNQPGVRISPIWNGDLVNTPGGPIVLNSPRVENCISGIARRTTSSVSRDYGPIYIDKAYIRVPLGVGGVWLFENFIQVINSPNANVVGITITNCDLKAIVPSGSNVTGIDLDGVLGSVAWSLVYPICLTNNRILMQYGSGGAGTVGATGSAILITSSNATSLPAGNCTGNSCSVLASSVVGYGRIRVQKGFAAAVGDNQNYPLNGIETGTSLTNGAQLRYVDTALMLRNGATLKTP